MRSIQKLLGLREAAPSARDTDSVRRIAAELEKLPLQQARYLAAFAYVLARVAHADLEISAAEVDHMQALVAREGGLAEPQAALIARLASHQAIHFSGTEDYLVTRQFGELATREQCLALVRCLYQVAAAQDSISTTEDGKIRQIANELHLSHSEVGAVRLQFRSKLAELRREN